MKVVDLVKVEARMPMEATRGVESLLLSVVLLLPLNHQTTREMGETTITTKLLFPLEAPMDNMVPMDILLRQTVQPDNRMSRIKQIYGSVTLDWGWQKRQMQPLEYM